MFSSVLCWLEVLGEAAAQLDPALRAPTKKSPGRRSSGMRNVLIHAYPNIVLGKDWAAIELLPVVQEKLDMILEGAA
jgi:uncharacterized protein with HEPN domain